MHTLYLLYPMECYSGWGAQAIVTSCRYTGILQVYRHPTSRQPSYRYADTQQVYSIQRTRPDTPDTRPDTQIQVQTPKIQVQPSSNTQIQVQTPKMQVETPKDNLKYMAISIHVQTPRIGPFLPI